MNFLSPEFFLFLAAVLAGVWLLRGATARKGLLLAASWYFYAWWDWRFLGLLLAVTLVDFAAGQGLGRARGAGGRRALLGLSLALNLGLLGFFKYANFFLDTLRPLASAAGWGLGALDLVLPLGLSFLVFRNLSYTIDVYRGDLRPCASLLDYALFTGFFPLLVAGPIERAAHFLPQLEGGPRPTRSDLYQGFQLLTQGVFLKVFLADRLALFTDQVFANAGLFDAATTWLAALAYTLQIYLDFAGYSAMAIGMARMLGLRIAENFRFPYLAGDIQDFWRRWHISLSTWIRDYLYFPLGGNRKGRVRTWVNLLLAMLLCGLWHGAAWTFVAWGGLHGLGLAAHRAFRNRGGGEGAGVAGRLAAWALTQLFVLLGWVLFRAESFGQAARMFRQMFLPQPGTAWLYPFVWVALAGVAAAHLLEAAGRWKPLLLPVEPRWYSPALLFSLLWLALLFAPEGFNPFLYARF